MIRKLRRRFIAAAMVSLFLVLLLLIGAINAINYGSVIRSADGTLDLLIENGGTFDFGPGGWENAPAGEPAPPDDPGEPTPPDDPGEPPGVWGNGPGGFDRSAELPFQTRYFTLTYDAAGTLTASNLQNVAAVSAEAAEALGAAALARGRARGFLSRYRYRLTAADGETTLLFLDCQRDLSTARTFLLASAVISAVGLLLVFLLIVLLSGRIVRPISESYEKQKRFITDAGHELKTPLTIINADADLLEQDLPDSEWLQDIRVQTKRLGTLTNDLIYLSRMEEDGGRLRFTDFCLSDAVAQTARGFRGPAKTRDLRLTERVAPLLTVCGDEAALTKLTAILLDNAIKYTPAGGAVDLCLERAGKQVRLAVTNDTENLDPAALDRLFDRFYRADASRSSETGGYGLGLSIARAVVTAHRGKISAAAPRPGTLCIEVLLNEKR